MIQPESTRTLRLPRILCLHGGGSNARIFRAQCRVISAHLKGHFRLVFAEGRLPAQPGPDVLSVYREWGPFQAWFPGSLSHHQPQTADQDATDALDKIEEALLDPMDVDERLGATGPWVGLLGFSQGAKACASVLLRQQQTLQAAGRALFSFSFGIPVAGRGPLVCDPAVSRGNGAWCFDDDAYVDGAKYVFQPKLQIPTAHVHGSQDPGLEFHRRMLEDCATPVKPPSWNGKGAIECPFAPRTLVAWPWLFINWQTTRANMCIYQIEIVRSCSK
ncbi:citrinin biosynthesis oxydoreductase CtnB [Metarhizium guizhouense ARSEF 977]|uniref:Citrinin biosynthesis oxydoreductase CtnB n=1 Tax=Metarhizium guizhouense (strain ARSEF 977) TaxID=1276136 RepID=A0A0B4GHN1_METGA|nr:citrinin biosynthesis oxydoreductase CtnB [Metarhizium guizhouense ARSEF 977]